ncbi:MAG: family 1 encapsulin nanocompartment shell protein [Chitinophagales bacterium]
MDLLRKNLAPISKEAWNEINHRAEEILTAALSARKFVDVDGPKGWDFAAVNKGRLDIPKGQKGNLKYGVHQVQPLVESRANFSLNIWELDNAVRGANVIDLDNLEEAAHEIAAFEEKVIYYGLKEAGVPGLKNASDQKQVKFEKGEGLLKSVTQALSLFKEKGVEGPFSLVLNREKWQQLAGELVNGYPLKKQILKLIEGDVIFAPNTKEAFLVSQRGGDFRLTLGSDISIGYDNHDGKKVDLFFTESFTFEVLDPDAVVVLS